MSNDEGGYGAVDTTGQEDSGEETREANTITEDPLDR